MAYGYVLFASLIILTNAQSDMKFFRDDYKALEGTGNVYKVHTKSKTWNDAKRRCALEGSSLFYPEDTLEAETVLNYLKTTQPSISSVFVGISSQLAKGVFMTPDGIAVRDIYNKWLPGEPNDENGEEDCVILNRDGFYNDIKCNKNYPFICKKSILSIKWNYECNVPYSDYKYSKEQRKCYKFHLNPLNWKNAAEACEAEQAYLAIANSQQEANYFANITAEAPKDTVQGWYLRGAVHLGFLFNDTVNDWTTIKGETLNQTGYDGWAPYQPDGGENERCGSMFYGGELNDISCELHKCFFICEKRQSKFFRDDYHYLEDMKSFYKIHTIKRNWQEAKEICDLESATLFYPENQDEVQSVINYWNNTQPFDSIFIGVTDLAVKGIYTTVDGVSINHVYNRWAPGEPNNLSGKEDCLILRRDGLINDDECNQKFPFICKKLLALIKWNHWCVVPDYDYKYSEENGRCYKFHTTPRTWMRAALVCDIEQSYLAVINSDTEAQHLVNLTTKAINKHGIKINLYNSVALGFSNKDGAGWKTILGEKLDESGYNQWASSQSNVGGTEQCGAMNYDGLLNEINCENKFYFICEHEIQELSILDDRFNN